MNQHSTRERTEKKHPSRTSRVQISPHSLYLFRFMNESNFFFGRYVHITGFAKTATATTETAYDDTTKNMCGFNQNFIALYLTRRVYGLSLSPSPLLVIVTIVTACFFSFLRGICALRRDACVYMNRKKTSLAPSLSRNQWNLEWNHKF